MADSRELTFGMDFGLSEAIDRLEDVVEKLGGITEQAQQAEDAGRGIGSGIEAGTAAAAAGAQKATDAIRETEDAAEDAGDGVGTNFRKMGSEADDFGKAVSKSMGTALKEGDSTAKSLKAGFQGAIGYTEKKFTGFFNSFKKGAKSIGTAIVHPVKTIKEKLGAALLEAGSKTDDLGDEAKDAGKKLDDMGAEGSEAGAKIKDAIGGALKTFLGIEAIKAGIELLKNFVSSALEAAGAAENAGAKFDASFKGTDAAEWVGNYADAVHRSKSEVESFMVSNKAMYGELGITGEAATDLSKATTSLAYDFGNAFSMSDADALGVVQDYINGNSAALEEYGIHIDETALKNSAMEMGLGSQIDSLDDAAMAQVRLNALLGQSGDIQQAAINSTGGLVNSTKSLKGIWGDFMADAGAKFAPTLEKLFGSILDAWPTIEPMLLNFVDILSNGMEQAAPVLIKLGETLIPVLTSVLGTLFEAATPLLSVFGELAQTILPPVASIVGLIAESVMPPLIDILSTLNTAIIQPLMPVIQKLAEALLPPIAQLLGVISPILEAVSPVLGVIGDVLGIIGEVLGKVVGWLADGVGKVVGFFSGLFGGAKDSETAVNDLSGAVSGLDSATSKETSLVVDTSDYKSSVEGAAKTTTAAVSDSSKEAKEITDVNFAAMGASATASYGTMQTDAETAWAAMTNAAETGAQRIVDAFGRITAAAKQAGGASNISVGASIPHNARGTDNFGGGLTYMNEEGGEIAMLPSGTAIIPADKSDRLVNSINNQTSDSRSVSIAPSIQITVQGGADDSAIEKMKAQLEAVFRDLYKAAQEEDYSARAMQQGFV
ncbi:hypothetical protein [Faecalispora jeddahensis]|uniref:hypothetical protein n=1 Tax=Faecalispora jeddahensis TaxID=1414721 RepID=UPI0027B90C6F|nr:hypothetical protein [Faecalispora jeddahensis]